MLKYFCEFMKQIILASASPRRKEILERVGLIFKVDPSNIKEDLNLDLEPLELAKYLSLQKAQDVAKRYKDAVIIGADTFVLLNGEILGKPKTKENAKKMLTELSGKCHLVITGFTIIDTKLNKVVTKSAETKVYFKKMSDKEIEDYVETNEPLDKAGAYAIQEKGGIFVEKIEGDFFNIVGLPLFSLIEELKEFGVFVLKFTP